MTLLLHLLRKPLPTIRPLLSNNNFTPKYFSSTSKSKKKYFDKILIANRGEISLRVMRTCNKLGINTVSVHSTADINALHTKLANESICIGQPSSLESYLNIDNILHAANITGSNAIHPGYGFLSENSDFCRRISESGLVFIGPPTSAIESMGDKITSKKIASAAGVNTIPGFQGILTSPDEAVNVAKDIGYPVMIKATSGGGGKGMRICYTDDDVKEGYRLSTQEAKKFFNDERLFIEKYIEKPHHIELQVLGDKYGNVLVFPERECSIQRRNQKIIEESPSVLLHPDTRSLMVKQAKALCKEVGYYSAGTCEFLVDENQNFYFLEMNTRLQVEHPVTEMITGIDLVELMIKVAADEKIDEHLLKAANDNMDVMPCTGWAMEARIYAEDPIKGFLPSNGPLLQYVEPITTNNDYNDKKHDNDNTTVVRCDSGVAQGHVISTHYDPLISKLIIHSPTRTQTINGLNQALDRYVIDGVGNNTQFVLDVCRNQSFINGDTPTSFIPTHYPNGFSGVSLTADEKLYLAASLSSIYHLRCDILHRPPLTSMNGDYVEVNKDNTTNKDDDSNSKIVLLGGLFGEAFKVTANKDNNTTVTIQKLACISEEEKEDESITTIKSPIIQYHPVKSPIAEVTLPSQQDDDNDNKSFAIQILKETNTNEITIQSFGCKLPIMVLSPSEYKLSQYMHEPIMIDMSQYLLSPMPGMLISYAVKEGDTVQLGQELCVVEAMKMQNVLKSEREGVIKKMYGIVGNSLRNDEIILEMES